MNNHIITTKNGQGKQLKCLNCNGRSRLKLKGGLMTFATELAKFERIHANCLPKVDGRAKQGKPKQPVISKAILCEVCGLEFKPMQGKVPLYRDDELRPAYSHPECADLACRRRHYTNKIVGGYSVAIEHFYKVGHHNLVVQSEGEWLYFWRGYMGSARNKAEAMQALANLRDNHADVPNGEVGAIG